MRWNQTGALACQDRGMQMRSFAMLLPCGISLFSGVEFVCCPKHYKGMQMIGPRVGKLLGYLFTEVVKDGKCVCVGKDSCVFVWDVYLHF